ncbi:unnamed protein product [Rhizophagus irregularis]|nr:unnamed protein product [Rhizophagus irregularis]
MPSILLNRKKSSGYNGKNRSNNSRKDKQQQSESSSIRSLELNQKLLDCSSSNNEARVQCFCGDSYDGGVGRHLGSEIVGCRNTESNQEIQKLLDSGAIRELDLLLYIERFYADSQQSYFTLRLPVKTSITIAGLVKKKLCNRKPLKVVPLMMYLGENFVSAFN